MLKMVEYYCAACRERWESLEETPVAATAMHDACGLLSDYVVSAPKHKTVWGWAQRGKNHPDDKPPNAVDTEALADGMQLHQWKAARKKKRDDQRRARIRRMLG